MLIFPIAVLPENANYNYILHGGGQTAVVDPSLAAPVIDVLEERGWKLDLIINTHHHWDHTGGNLELKSRYGAQVMGYGGDAARIPGIDIRVAEGDEVAICGEIARVLFIPGHTLGHIAYYFAGISAVFCGDTLFGMGCGRLFEGTPEQMFASLQTLAALPPETLVYCGHEYTEANGRFALTIEPDNPELHARMAEVTKLRQAGLSTVPSTIALEKQTNPFLRAGNAEEFARVRRLKDAF